MSYAPETRKPARFKVTDENGGRAYTFYCDLSGAAFWKSEPISAVTPDEELKLAWSEAQKKVNVCHKCGRNVIDALYNAETMECVKCSPWQRQPFYCTGCGAKLSATDTYCSICGMKIRQEGVDENAEY